MSDSGCSLKVVILKKKFLIITGIEFVQSFTKPVGQPSSHLVQNVSFVVIAQCPCHFVIGHVRSISVLAPKCCKGVGIMEPKQAFFSVLPVHHVVIGRLLQNPQGELPQLSRGWYI